MTHVEYYIRDSEGNQRYKKSSNGNEYYAFVLDASKIFAKDKDNNLFYAKRNDDEFYPYISNKPIYIILKDGTQVYAKKSDGTEIYPRTHDGKQLLLIDKDRKFYYAKNSEGREIYPKQSNGKEYMIAPDVYAKNQEGRGIYPLNKNGKPIYPLDQNGNEVYLLKDPKTHLPIFGLDKDNKQIYAKDFLQNEYYPEKGMLAQNMVGEDIYAISKDNQIIYPKHASNNEYYLETNSKDSFSYLLHYGKTYKYDYAKLSNGREIYPKLNLSNGSMQVYIKNKYAKNENGHFYYPMDEFGNEYLLDFALNLPESNVFANGYPVTRDDFYIVPNINGKAYILSNVSDVEIRHIVAQLYRQMTDYKDFLTNVKSKQRPFLHNFYPPYKTRPILATQITKYEPSITSSNTWIYIWAILGLLLMFTIVKLLNKKR